MSCLREYTKYATLNVFGMLGLSCYILADTYFVANGLGSNGLAALNLAIPIYSFIHGTGLMLGMGGATRYSMMKSQGEEEGKNRVFTHTMILGGCFAVLFVLLGLFGSEQITRLLGADEAVFSMCHIYLKVMLLFSPAVLLDDIMLCFVRNDGAPQLSMAAMLTGSFSNIVLDYLFIFTFRMGIFGAVFATGLAPIISLLVQSRFLIRRRNQFHFTKCASDRTVLRHIFAGGAPSLVAELSSGIVMIIFNMVMLGLEGNTGVAAYGVIANLSLVVIAIYTGIAQGIQPLLSRYYGMRDPVCIRKIFQYAVITVLVLSFLIYAGMFFGASEITAVFNSEKNAEMQLIAAKGIRLYFTGCIFAGFNIVLAICFTATDKAGPANLISLLRGFVLIVPMTFLLALLGGVTGLWLSFPVTELLVSIAGILLVRHSRLRTGGEKKCRQLRI